MKLYLPLLFSLLSLTSTFAQFGPKTHLSGCLSCGNAGGGPHDVDNDGDEDILLYSYYDGKLSWYENDGNGNFDSQHIIHLDTAAVDEFIDLADLDGDGFKNIIINSSNSVPYFYQHDPGANFTTKVLIPELPTGADFIHLVDIDSDGDMDISTREIGTDFITVLYNDGTGDFTSLEIPTNGINIRNLNSGDVDNDGDMDLVMTINPSTQLQWLEQLSDGTFASIADLTAVDGLKDEFHTADLNNDGLVDFLFSNVWNDKVGYLLNQGGGIFSEELILSDTVPMINFVVDDLDQDGDQDIFGFSNDGQVYFYENIGTTSFAPPTPIINGPYGGWLLATADFNQDQIKDILSLSTGGYNPLDWWAGQSDFSFIRNPMSSVYQNGISGIAAIDYDNDGDEDLFVTSLFSLNIGNSGLVYLNNGNGDFSDTIDVSPAFDGLTIGLQLGGVTDFDEDGDIDILPNDNSFADLYWVENLGNNNFEQHQIGAGIDDFYFAYLADINSDGLEDIVTYSSSAGNVWFENLGNGNFSPMTAFSSTAVASTRFTTEDFEGDGDLDVILAGTDGFYLLENDGAANFSEVLLLDNIEFIKEVKVADVNGDGLKDIIYLQGNNNFSDAFYFRYVRNEGAGNWSAPIIFYDSDIEIKNLKMEDVNNDGYMDFFVLSQDDFVPPTKMGWIENYGPDGFFPIQFLDAGVMDSRDFTFLDMDNDGYKELIQAEEYRLQYFENLSGKPTISGQLFWDENENQLKDQDELSIPGLPVSISPAPLSSFSDDEGNYRFYVDPGAYTIAVDTADLTCWALTTDSVSYDVSVATGLPVNRDFGFNSTGAVDQFAPGLTSGPTRCGFTVPFWLSVENVGCSIDQSQFAVVLDTAVTFISATIPPTMINGDTLFWESDTLVPGQIDQVKLELEMPGVQALGSVIHLSSLAYANDGNGNYQWSNTFEFYSVINCAYDPNDKLVHPSQENSEDNYALFDDQLTYTIRFQNTGTDTAFNIVIRDTLDDQLDWNTFQPLNSSHHFESSINRDNGALEFNFPNILLPDSNVNEVLSHGFVRFRISANEDLENNTVITNTAHIYFDFNPAIVTNTIQSTLVDGFIAVAEIQSPLCQGDENGMIQASFPFFEEVNYLWSNNETDPLLTDLPPGDYGLSITDNDGQLLVDTLFTLTDPPLLTAATSSSPAFDGNNNGTTTATATGGTAPYSYAWNTVPVQTTETATDLPPGDYTVIITDDNGCTIEQTASVGEASGVASFNSLLQFAVMPNPVEEMNIAWVKLQFNSPTIWQLELSNALGQQLGNYENNPLSMVNAEVQIGDLRSGIYFLTLTVNEKVVGTKRLVVVE